MTPPPGATRLSALVLALTSFLLIPLHANAQELPTVPDSAAATDDADTGAIVVGGLRLPSVEWPSKRLFCVEYARLRSGLAIFGDAKLWWSHAHDLYDEFAQPAVDAVMVFSGSKRIRRGHVAVVTDIVSPREIIVDHANWQNHGEIDHDTPVLDVSARNDWSAVRVWDMNSNQWGAHTYRISGFIGARVAAAMGAGS
jgi:hypothetical protein